MTVLTDKFSYFSSFLCNKLIQVIPTNNTKKCKLYHIMFSEEALFYAKIE